jgi:hypothetical protein
MTPTPWYLSKTVIFNALTTLAAILSFLPTVSNLIPAEALPILLAVVGAVNIVLRIWFTDNATTVPFGQHVK